MRKILQFSKRTLISLLQVHPMIILVIRKIDNGYFIKENEQYQVWKLVSPGSVILNHLREVQVGRSPEPNDIE